MSTIHKGFIDKRFYDSFKDTGLNDVDLATTKVYLGVHPMWKQLGFSQNSLFDNPASKYYWGNILPKKIAGKRVTFENMDGIEGKRVDAKPDLEKGMQTPRKPYNYISINPNVTQDWENVNSFDNRYYYPVLPRIDKFGVFTEIIDEQYLFGSKPAWNEDDELAPITDLDEKSDNLILNIDFNQNTSDDILDKTELNTVQYNQDFQIKLDDNLRITTDEVIISDELEGKNSKQAF